MSINLAQIHQPYFIFQYINFSSYLQQLGSRTAHRGKVVHHKRKPDGSMAVAQRAMSAVGAKMKSSEIHPPQPRIFQKMALWRHFLVKNSVPRRSSQRERRRANHIFCPPGQVFICFPTSTKSSKVIFLKKTIFLLLLNLL